ncbi:PepSY-associated TM helix domain-containing protein [Kolteria novifilia]|uniref:PepSY-associated TM helix domain-containing protein n=1 Tax=Kolteria novifilia TaxID=2527975 RepID=UPI003AF40214
MRRSLERLDGDRAVNASTENTEAGEDSAKRRQRFNYRKLFWRWHKLAGLLGGPLLVLIALTGAILVFSPEIDDWLRPDLKVIESPIPNAEPISDQAMIDLVREHVPDKRLLLYFQGEHSHEPYQFLLIGNPKEGLHDVWVNPYSGEIVGDRMRETAFVRIVEQIHRRLLTGEVGSSIVEFITGWGIVLVLTGLFMWWPRNLKALRHGLTVPFRGSGYKINWRLHNAVGAWIAVFILLMCLTGMVFSTYSGKIYRSIMQATGGAFGSSVTSTPTPGTATVSVDKVLEVIRNEVGQDAPLTVFLPNGEKACYVVQSRREERPVWTNRHDYRRWSFDQYSGEMLKRETWHDVHPMMRFWILSLTIHYGSFIGWPTKILAIVACLTLPILAVTGYLIWWWKRRARVNSASGPSAVSNRVAARAPAPVPKGLIVCLVGVGIVFPTIGVSFLALLGWEGLVRVVRGKPGQSSFPPRS